MSTQQIVVVNPATEQVLATYPTHDAEAIEALVKRTARAAQAWRRTPVSERAVQASLLADQLRNDSAILANLIVAEMGKPIAEARGEVEKSAVTADYYAANAVDLLADERVDVAPHEAWVAYEPLGVLLAVMPWNFPVWQVMRFLAPALTAGNAVLLKHSPNVTGSALELQALVQRAGYPEGLLTTLVVAEPDVPETIEKLIADDRIVAVTLTGSNRAGAAVGAAAGRHSKKSVLELGGSDAFVVLDDADVHAAATAAVRARYTNSGQSCVCAKRFIVHRDVAEEFTAAFLAGVEALTMGDPSQDGVNVGPMARDDLRDAVQRQVDESIAAGAELLAGGKPVAGTGYFYEPTVLGRVRPGMAVFDEETFGPVAAITVAANDADIVNLANDTEFGLGLSIWSTNHDRAIGVAKRITSGAAFVNAIVASDPRVPFGGTKKSGYGRELAAAGIREFSNTRTYWIGA